MPALSLSRRLATALARHADHAFGLMGNGNAHLIDGLDGTGIRYVAVRHEAGAVAAADAFTRVSGRIAVATVTYGAGFTNTVTALAEAAIARTPMLVVVGDAPTGGPRPWDVDQPSLASAVGASTVVLTPDDVDAQVDRAVAETLLTRRPVVVAIPYDLAAAPVDDPARLDEHQPAEPGEAEDGPAPLDELDERVELGEPENLDAAIAVLARAERPVVLAGHGAWIAGVGAELGRLAESLGALTASSALGRGIFPDRRYDLGLTGGFGQDAAMAVLAEADAVLVVGASLNQFTTRFGELFGRGTTVVRVDVDEVDAPRSVHPISHLLLRGDARTVLPALIERIAEARPAPSAWREQHSADLEPGGALRVLDDGRAEHPDGLCADGLLDPRSVAARLAELLPENRHVTSDGGHFIGWANMFWPVASPERMIMVGTAYQTIGLGLPTVAGVAAAAPDTTIVLTTGDGGGLMALADLETAIRTARRCVIVVWNDGAYGAEVHLYGAMGLDERPMRIPDVDFAALAVSLGAVGLRVETLADLDALTEWRDAGGEGTILLDCRVSRSIVAPYQVEIQRVNGVTPK